MVGADGAGAREPERRQAREDAPLVRDVGRAARRRRSRSDRRRPAAAARRRARTARGPSRCPDARRQPSSDSSLVLRCSSVITTARSSAPWPAACVAAYRRSATSVSGSAAPARLRRLLDQVQVLHEEVELHLRRELAANHQRAPDLEHLRGRRPRAEHVDHQGAVQAAARGHRQRLGDAGAVERDQQVGDELEQHRLAGGADVDRARQNGLEHRAPALVERALAAHEEHAVALRPPSRWCRSRGSRGTSSPRALSLAVQSPGQLRRDRAHLHDRLARRALRPPRRRRRGSRTRRWPARAGREDGVGGARHVGGRLRRRPARERRDARRTPARCRSRRRCGRRPAAVPAIADPSSPRPTIPIVAGACGRLTAGLIASSTMRVTSSASR